MSEKRRREKCEYDREYKRKKKEKVMTVSYTHLTLPTICSV